MDNLLDADDDLWLLAEPSAGLALAAGDQGVHLQSRVGLPETPRDLTRFQPATRLGRLLPTLIPQLLEIGAARHEMGEFRISYEDFVGLEDRGFDAFEGVAPWSPFILELQCSGYLTGERFTYFLRFYLGNHPVHIGRRGCFVRRAEQIYRLDPQTFKLVSAVEEFNSLPLNEKASTDSLRRFAHIKGLADELGAELDEYLTRERVLVPSSIGLDMIIDSEGRITFVPKIDGVPDDALRESFLAVDDVDACYTCAVDGGRIRVVLTDSHREVLRRMQHVRHLGGAERTEVLRDPVAVFDGVAEAVDLDLTRFGPRVRGVGDFPFIVRPYLQRSVTGIFEDTEAHETTAATPFSAGLACTYVDGTEQRVAFTSRDEVLNLKAAASEAWRSGTGHVAFRNKSIVIDEPFLQSLKELLARITRKPSHDTEQRSRRFLLIYTNEEKLEYEEDSGPVDDDKDLELPASLLSSIELMDHQRHGIAWLERNFRLGRHGCLLADDMGLGKTLQTLIFLAWVIEQGFLGEASTQEHAPWNPILIVAPVILLENEVWLNEMRQFFSGDGAVFQPWLTMHGSSLKAHRVSGATGSETIIGAPVLDLDALRQYRVILTNYETITNYQHSFARMKDRWTVVVTDEAQEYKTPSTKISHALKSLSPRFRMACTGTPVETRLLDVWNIFDFLQPGRLLGSSSEFSKRFERTNDQSMSMPSSQQVQDLKRALRYGSKDAFVLRRSKTDILTDLPPKYEHRLRCDLSETQRRWHADLIGRARSSGEGDHPLALIQQLMRLVQHPALVPTYEPVEPDEALSSCPKLVELMKTLERIRAKSEKALIFTRSLDMQQLLSSVLQAKLGVAAEIVNGATSRRGGSQGGQRTRQAILNRFRESPGFDVIILSPDVAGIGLTLVEANHVFHYGRWWNPAKESQATDRAYRIGQDKDVHVYYLIGMDPLRQFETFDEKLDALIERRRTLASDFLSPIPSEEDLERELLNDVVGSVTTTGSSVLPNLGEEEVRNLPWDRFEALVAFLWATNGNDVILTSKAADEGIDVISIQGQIVELVQCKHTLWGASVDADAIAEVIQAFDGYRARRFRQSKGNLTFRVTLATNGSFTAAGRRSAKERDVRIVGGAEILRLLAAQPCTAADVDQVHGRRLASMRDVQARITSNLEKIESAKEST